MLKLLTTVWCLIVVNSEEWRYKQLDPEGNYNLYWSFSGDVIVFQVEVATNGWIGFGISPNGGMSGSDVMIGWLSDGNTTTFHDRHASGEYMPTIDEHQDWELLWSHENDTHTLLRFQRKLNTCDKEEDREIKWPTTRVIYAYSHEDPASANSVKYHGPVNRGSKSLSLFEEGNEKRNLGAPQDLLYWEIRAPNVTVPHDTDTSYLCTIHKRPNVDRFHHIIKIEAIIQPGLEQLVHHMLLLECTDGNEAELEPLMIGYHECYTKDRVSKFSFCFAVTAGWAVGGEEVYLPEYTGLPFGRSNAVYYILEIHYNNPGYVRGMVDSSGFRLTYTPKLRKYNGGIMIVGNVWNECTFIPPKQKDFTVSGHAHPSCLRQEIPSDGIKVFRALLHSHLAGKKIKVRHFRENQELPHIISDDYYDFNYQNYVMLPKERVILPKDHIIVECSYDTSQRKETTHGGLSTQEEMCVAHFIYYPEVQLAYSVSCPSPINLVKVLGVTQMSDDDKYLMSPISGKNESYFDFLKSYPWDDNSVNAVQRAMKYSPHLNVCNEKGGKRKLVLTLSRYPNVRKFYQEPDECAIRITQKEKLKPNSGRKKPIP